VIPLRLRARLHNAHGRLRARAWQALYRGVEVGAGARIGRGCRLILEPGARIVLGERCVVDDAVTLAAYGTGSIELGPRTFVGHHSTLAARHAIAVGAGTFVAELVSVRDHDHAVGLPPSSGRVDVAPVSIGADVWVGAKVTVLRGASIGDGTVVGANGVVRGEVPARAVVAGVPVRVLRLLDSGR
jgi:acetyltransferase-like isoleucine patch superfamily enzyme